MTRQGRAPLRPIVLAVWLTLAALALSASASASTTTERQQGAQIVGQIQAGKLSRSSLTRTQYERVGEYLMGRAFGSSATFGAMDAVMDRMMGQTGADATYLYLGERYLGQAAQLPSRSSSLYSWMAGVMRRYYGNSPYAGMMSGYLGGTGYRGSGADYPTGAGMMGYVYGNAAASGGWPTGAIIAVAALAALLLGGGIVLLVRPKLRARRQAATPVGPRL